MTAYVIRAWKVAGTPIAETGNYVSIEGRAGGLISWLLSLLGVSPIVTIAVDQQRITFTEGSWSGSASRIIPLENVCSTYYGYYKPWKEALVFGALLAVPTFGISVILALIYYFLNKSLTIGFVEYSGVASAISFKRSVIEGQDIEEKQARFVCEVVQWLVDERKKSFPQISG